MGAAYRRACLARDPPTHAAATIRDRSRAWKSQGHNVPGKSAVGVVVAKRHVALFCGIRAAQRQGSPVSRS